MEVKKAEDNSQIEKLRLETLPFSCEKTSRFLIVFVELRKTELYRKDNAIPIHLFTAHEKKSIKASESVTFDAFSSD